MNKIIFICNECGNTYYGDEYGDEPDKCKCGMDNFGIEDRE